jgi:hypothetical protein
MGEIEKFCIEFVQKHFEDEKTYNQSSIITAMKVSAKWQAERSYSEEEVIELLKTFDIKFNSGIVERNKGIKEWFKQFKKQ